MVAKAAGPRLVEEHGEVLYPDDGGGVRANESSVCHDGDNYVLFHIEPAGVEVPRVAESREFRIREDGLEQLACRETTNKGFVRKKEKGNAMGVRAYSN